MARGNHGTEFEIEVGGETYVWRLQRLPQWSTDSNEWRGKAIAVRHKEGKREAVVEFPSEPPPKFGAPPLKAAQISARRAPLSAVTAFGIVHRE